jgi:hypothetical protein
MLRAKDLKMSPLFQRLFNLAREHKLDRPLGRAAALVNRHYNDGHSRNTDEESLLLMRAFSDETAARWDMHVANGGSLKKLGLTREDQLKERRAADKARREYHRSFSK